MDQGSYVSRPKPDCPAGALSWQHDEQRDNIKKEGIKKGRKRREKAWNESWIWSSANEWERRERNDLIVVSAFTPCGQCVQANTLLL